MARTARQLKICLEWSIQECDESDKVSKSRGKFVSNDTWSELFSASRHGNENGERVLYVCVRELSILDLLAFMFRNFHSAILRLVRSSSVAADART